MNYILKFKNVEHGNRLPIVIYADFESVLRNIDTCFPEESKSSTTAVQYHEPVSYCLNVVANKEKLKPSQIKFLPKTLITYRKKIDQESVGKHFMEDLRSLSFKIQQIYAQDDPMIPLTEDEKNYHSITSECYMCKKQILDKKKTGNYKVRDHDHLTGRYRGPAHR